MKKSLFYTLALGLLLSLGACSSDESLVKQSQGDEATLTFTAKLPSNIASRAYSDGTSATNLSVLVYQKTGDDSYSYVRTVESTFTEKQASVSIRLMKKETYRIVFWAQADGAPYTIDNENHSIAMNFASDGNTTGNDETRDAFLKIEEDITVSSDLEKTIELTRPFAQLNIGTEEDDFTAAKANGYEFTKAIVTTQSYQSLDLLTGEAIGDAEDVTFEAEFPTDQTFPLNDGHSNDNNVVDSPTYKYLSMNYILVKEDEKSELSNVTLKVSDAEGSATEEFEYTYVPVQRNYRTNIYGNLFTNEFKYNVEINSDYEEPCYGVVRITQNNANKINTVLNGGGTVVLDDDVSVNYITALPLGTESTIELNGHTMTVSIANGLQGDLTINGGTTSTASRSDNVVKGKIVFNTAKNSSAISVLKTGNLKVIDAEIEAPNGWAIYVASDGAKLHVENSTITSISGAIGTNASTPYSAEISLESSTFKGSAGVLLNVPVDVTIKDCKFYGYRMGAFLRGGTYNISNSEFYLDLPWRAEVLKSEGYTGAEEVTSEIGTHEQEADKAENGSNLGIWNTGTGGPLSALVIGNRASAYQYATIFNGTLADSKAAIIPQDGFVNTNYSSVYIWANQTDEIGVYFNFSQDDMIKIPSDDTAGRGIIYGSKNIFFNGTEIESNYATTTIEAWNKTESSEEE